MWTTRYNYADNAISVPLQFGRLYITVYAANTSTFQIGVFTLDKSLEGPILNETGIMKAESPEIDDIILKNDYMKMNVTFNSTGVEGTKYRLYSILHANRDTLCGLKNKVEHPEECIVKTQCGINRLIKEGEESGNNIVKLVKEWTDDDDENYVIVDQLIQNINYTFNIVAELPEGLNLTYTGTEGTPEFHYEATSVDNTTTIIIIVVVCVLIVIVVAFMILLKIKLSKSYKKMP